MSGPAATSGAETILGPWFLSSPIWAAAAGFLLGSVPFAYLLGRVRGIDLRACGSGNVGATNLGRNAGFGWGVVAFLLDASKGGLPTWGAIQGGQPELGAILAGSAAVIGHCYSPFLAFRGGKGVATMAGVLAALAPWTFLLLAGVWVATVALTRNVGISSVAAAVGAIGRGITILAIPTEEPHPWLGVLLLTLPVVVIVRHRENIRRFRARRGEDR